ncbi:MAG: SEC-C domain-containing protein [Desulfovibrio sp.]|nr:SEC-C domain-containing protein [Desulfovibrio sp.]
MSELCPCGSGRTYEKCCAPYVEGGEWPPDAETLMRSRYTAYACRRYDWLVESTHPEYRRDITAEKLAASADEVHWLRLDIRSTAQNVASGEKGELFDVVEFCAYYQLDGTRVMAERSFFQRMKGKIYYVKGEALRFEASHRESPKVGRNDPCPCGSGKKYKKCCGAPA